MFPAQKAFACKNFQNWDIPDIFTWPSSRNACQVQAASQHHKTVHWKEWQNNQSYHKRCGLYVCKCFSWQCWWSCEYDPIDSSCRPKLDISKNFNSQDSNINHVSIINELERVQTTLKQLVRDWSAEGAKERMMCYQPIIDEVLKNFPANLW